MFEVPPEGRGGSIHEFTNHIFGFHEFTKEGEIAGFTI